MSIVSTINYRNAGGSANVSGSPVSLLQDSSGNIFHGGVGVESIDAKLSDSDTQVTYRIASSGSHNVAVSKVESIDLQANPSLDGGGVTWTVAGTGMDVVITAPGIVNNKRKYLFDDPGQPSIKLKITVERT